MYTEVSDIVHVNNTQTTYRPCRGARLENTHARTHMYTCTHARAHTHTRMHAHTCTHARTHTHTHTHTHTKHNMHARTQHTLNTRSTNVKELVHEYERIRVGLRLELQAVNSDSNKNSIILERKYTIQTTAGTINIGDRLLTRDYN